MKIQKFVIFVKKSLKINILKIKNTVKLEIIVITQLNTEVQYSVPKEVPVVFHCGSNYDYQFIIQELAEKFEGYFTYLGENTEKHLTFFAPIEKQVIRISKNGEEITKTISYRLKTIDSARFMASSLSNLVSSLSEGIYKIKSKYKHDDKNVKFLELNTNTVSVILNIQTYINGLIEYKCLCCNKIYQKKFDGNLKKRFANTYKFANYDINKFTLLLRKGA